MTYIEIAQLLQSKIAFLVAYFPIVSIIGFLQAWIAYKMGDDTAKNWGFLTLDPLVHADLYGFIILLFPWQLFGSDINFGFGKFVPTDPEGLYGRFQKIRKVIILFSGMLAALLTWFLVEIARMLVFVVLTRVPQTAVLHYESLIVAFIKILNACLSLTTTLFFIFLIINGVDALLYKFDKKGVIKQNLLLRFLIIMAAALLAEPLLFLVIHLIKMLIQG